MAGRWRIITQLGKGTSNLKEFVMTRPVRDMIGTMLEKEGYDGDFLMTVRLQVCKKCEGKGERYGFAGNTKDCKECGGAGFVGMEAEMTQEVWKGYEVSEKGGDENGRKV